MYASINIACVHGRYAYRSLYIYAYIPSNTHKQRNWDDIQCSSAVATLVPVLNQHRLACFKAASRPESGV